MSILANTAVSLVLLSAITGAKISSTTTDYGYVQAPVKSAVVTSKPIAAKAPEAKLAAQPALVIVPVQPGDTLSSIANANGTTYARIFAANPTVADPNIITVGQQITIPDPTAILADRPLPATSSSTAATSLVVASSPVVTASYSLSGDAAKDFIYSHESGNNPNATSGSGCYGLGQDCNGVVRNQCGADYACQDAYFTSYAVNRYGSWDAAASFWQTNGWW